MTEATQAIARLREMLEAATPGEWYPNTFNFKHEVKGSGNVIGFVRKLPDAAFIAAAKNAMPALLACAEALEKSQAALREAARLREAPSEPGEFVGDIFYGNPERTTEGTHRWTGSEWVRLPTDAEALTALLAKSREEADLLRASLRDTLDFLERHSNRWDGVNGKHPQTVVTAARAALQQVSK